MKIFLQFIVYFIILLTGLNVAASGVGAANASTSIANTSGVRTLSAGASGVSTTNAGVSGAAVYDAGTSDILSKFELIYPYSMSGRQVKTEGTTTLPLYVSFTEFDVKKPGLITIQLKLPDNFIALKNAEWQEKRNAEGVFYEFKTESIKGFSRSFSLLYIKPLPGTSGGEKTIRSKVFYTGENKKIKTLIREKTFQYVAKQGESSEDKGTGASADTNSLNVSASSAGSTGLNSSKASADAKKYSASKSKAKADKFNWYILSVILPVDEDGHKDPKSEDGAIYVPDNKIEDLRNRITGDGATNWAAVLEHPVCYLQLNIRNPQQDVAMLKFKAFLKDRKTGEIVPGLCTGGKSDSDNPGGGFSKDKDEYATTAVFTLDGSKASSVILPVYVDSLRVLPGDYSLRIELQGAGQDKATEIPVSITKRHSMGIFAVIFAVLTLPLLIYKFFRLNRTVEKLGARGAITVALFAAVSFGGITIPTTLLSDFIHAFLGPFSVFITGCLSGIMQYLLLMALLILFRRPGVITLLLLLKFILTAVIFGRFTPLGILSLSVNITILELALKCSGFYAKEKISKPYMLIVALVIGLADAFINFINLEQMMFFYRLYYADWYIILYLAINGLIYSSIGAFFGYGTGSKLKQIAGE